MEGLKRPLTTDHQDSLKRPRPTLNPHQDFDFMDDFEMDPQTLEALEREETKFFSQTVVIDSSQEMTRVRVVLESCLVEIAIGTSL